jgi:VIT1/CCC1 family predicted Fe2+/Mn2+ transporter
MAAGEYVSVRSQRELLEAASHELDGPTLRSWPRRRPRNWDSTSGQGRARRPDRAAGGRAAQRGRRRAGGADIEAEATGTDVVGSAWGVAGFSFVSFATGATIPILPFLFTSGTRAIAVAAIVVEAALFAHRSDSRRGQRRAAGAPGLPQLGIGAAAALITYGLGRLFNTVIG